MSAMQRSTSAAKLRIERGLEGVAPDPVGDSLFSGGPAIAPPIGSELTADDEPIGPALTTGSYLLQAGLGERRRRALLWLAVGVVVGVGATLAIGSLLVSRLDRPVIPAGSTWAERRPETGVSFDEAQAGDGRLRAVLLGEADPARGGPAGDVILPGDVERSAAPDGFVDVSDDALYLAPVAYEVRERPMPPRPADAIPVDQRAFDGEAVAEILRRNRSAFEACATRAGDAAPRGARVGMTLTLLPSGRVEKVGFDDPARASAPFAACVEQSARRLRFPTFQGTPVDVGFAIAVAP